jgi:hypothetical protein
MFLVSYFMAGAGFCLPIIVFIVYIATRSNWRAIELRLPDGTYEIKL